MWSVILVSVNEAGKTSTNQYTLEDFESCRRCLQTFVPKRGYHLAEVNMYENKTLFDLEE